MKPKTIGVLGGLGPDTTAKFYLRLIKLSREKNKKSYPSIVIHNLPVTFKVEENTAIKGINLHQMLPFLVAGVKQLKLAKVDFIVIPCNTVHVFIDELRKTTQIPIISIIDKTLEHIRKAGIHKVGLLATNKTIKSGMFTSHNTDQLKIICPNKFEQQIVARTISHILKNKITNKDQTNLLKIIQNLKMKSAEAVILGCTDLQLIINAKNSPLTVCDTMEILAQATVSELNNN